MRHLSPTGIRTLVGFVVVLVLVVAGMILTDTHCGPDNHENWRIAGTFLVSGCR